MSWKWENRKSLELDRCFVFITVSVDCSTVDLINTTRIYTQTHTLSHLNNGKDDNGQTALLRSCNIVRRSCNQHTQKIPTNPIETELKLMIKKDRCKRSFLLNFIRTQMNQLVSVKQMRSSLYVREHLAFTFSSNASRRSLAIFMICDSYFVSSIKIIFTFIWFFYYYCCWFFVFVCWSMAFVTLYCFWLFNA